MHFINENIQTFLEISFEISYVPTRLSKMIAEVFILCKSISAVLVPVLDLTDCEDIHKNSAFYTFFKDSHGVQKVIFNPAVLKF